MTTTEFCNTHQACWSGREWALTISQDMAEVYRELMKPDSYVRWRLWVLTRRGVLPWWQILRLNVLLSWQVPNYRSLFSWKSRCRLYSIGIKSLYVGGPRKLGYDAWQLAERAPYVALRRLLDKVGNPFDKI